MSAASRLLKDPRVVAAAAAIAVRAAVAAGAPDSGPPALDGAYYLDWAGDIAGGDLLGRTGAIHGEAWLFNPLYAYVLAPIVLAAGKSPGAVVLLQTLLAGGTAALVAAAARRFAGTTAAWIAGLSVALSAALVHLDGKIAVSGVAAFLVAGAVWSLAPDLDGETSRRGRGPSSSGWWFGLSLLARPMLLFAIPFAAMLRARRSFAPRTEVLWFLVPIALCAGASFARNSVVGGEPVVFTAANGLNLHLGNNPDARRLRSMATSEFRFGPVSMHEDAKWRVAYELHEEPTRSQISEWFRDRAIADFEAAPGPSLVWCAEKLALFASPLELGSSEALETDRAANPALWLACVPTWLLVALAAASLAVARRGAGVGLGPGAIVLSHAAACVLVYPLSHYRSSAIPAMGVMTGVAIAGSMAAMRDRRSGRAFAALVVAAAVAAIGLLPESPPTFPEAQTSDRAADVFTMGNAEEADRLAASALEQSPDDVQSLTIRLIIANAERRFLEAAEFAARLARLRPWDPDALLDAAWADVRLERSKEGLAAADAVVALYPWSAKVRSGRGAMRVVTDDLAGGRDDLRWAIEHGFEPPNWALEKAGWR